MGPADLAGAAALGGILVWAVGYWSRISGRIEEEKDTFEWYAETATSGDHALFKQVESKDGKTSRTTEQDHQGCDLEAGPAKWEGSE